MCLGPRVLVQVQAGTSISPAQSASVIGGPPGMIPDASAGARYFLAVLRSTPSGAAGALFGQPAYW